MSDEEDLKKLAENDRLLRERLAQEENPVPDVRQMLKERAAHVVDSGVEPPTEDFVEAREAAKSSLQERGAYLREARGRKWDSKVPPRWRDWNMERLPKSFQVEANDWIANGFNEAKNLVLAGPTGSGKTSIAYSIGREIYVLGHKVKIWQAAELFDKMRNQETNTIVLESVKEADLLILDDLGSERQTEWVEERLFLIIDYRWQWQLPMIVTTNVPIEKINEHFSERITSRLMDGATTLVVAGKDYRAG